MKFEDLRANIMLTGPRWDRPVTLERFEQSNNRVRLVYRRDDDDTGNVLIHHTELEDIQIYNAPQGTPWRVKAAIEMLRHKHAKGGGTHHGKMDPLPHQIHAIYHITGQYGDVRFLLADEPGAGKTAVASSIIHEMRLQGRANRTLVVVPAHLKGQWKAEMRSFTGLKSFIVEGGSVSRSDPWPTDDHHILITSIDYAKRDANRATLAHMTFDLVVVDEAHHMNSSGKNVSVRYKLGQMLSKISTHILFLTATPHRGKPENFRLLLKLLQPELFSGDLTPGEVAARKNPMFMRHLKQEMTDMDGKPIFTKRDIKSLKYEMSIPEKGMYNMVSGYVREQHQRLSDMGERLAPFVLLLIQKRMASSTYALQKTLERRREKLKNHLDNGIRHVPLDIDDERFDDENDPEHQEFDDALSGISAARTTEELRAEIDDLNRLVDAANQAATTKPDKKLEQLHDIVINLGADEKLLIFSEYMDTINYLEKNLKEKVCRIDGNMKQTQRDEAVKAFRDTYRIMLATDAAREGINLQFCNTMINYDLPWSPVTLEQRMGRLHRYGQKKNVIIYNMIAGDTIESDVLERLSEKLEEIQKQYSAVDIIGAILSEVDMSDIMVESIAGRTVTGIDEQVSQAKAQLDWAQKMLEHTPVNRDEARRTRDEIAARHVDGKYLVRMMRTVFEGLDGKIKSTTEKTALLVPDSLRGEIFPNKHTTLSGPAEHALARGTKPYNYVESWITRNCISHLRGGSVFAGDYTGHIVFHTTDLKNPSGKVVEVLVQAHSVDTSGSVQAVSPDILYELDDVGGDPGPKPDTRHITSIASDDAQARADRLNDKKRQYWNKRIANADFSGRLASLQRQKGEFRLGTPDWNTIGKEIKDLESFQNNIDRRAKADQLYPEEPRLAGWVRVVRRSDIQDTEIRGMNRSMEIERHEGWVPEDVSAKHGIGYDIRSRHPDGRERHIEVKARCQIGAIQFTPNEQDKVHNDPNYRIHVHIIEGQTHRTFLIEDPTDLNLKKRTICEMSKSEFDRVAIEYQPVWDSTD